MSGNNIIVEYADFEEQRIDPKKSHFKELAKEFFEIELTKKKKSKGFHKEFSKFASLNLTSEINDVFIDLNKAPFFWAAQTPLIIYLEKFIEKSLSVVGGLDDYKEIKENYLKWLEAQTTEDKKFFAIQTLKLSEQSITKYNFFNPILSAVILIFSETLFDAERALALIAEAKGIIEKLKITDEARIELLYLIEVYKGFVFLKLKEFENAKITFQNALNLKHDGITAIFYISYAELRLENYMESAELLQKIWMHDLRRINYSIDQNNVSMFYQFVENSVFQNIFYYDEFSTIVENIELIINEFKEINESTIKTFKDKVSSFLTLKSENPELDIDINNFFFIEKLITSFSERKNIYFLAILKSLENKFESGIQQIIYKIRSRYEKEIRGQIKSYEDETDEKRIEIEKLETYLEEIKTEINHRRTEDINFIESKFNTEIATLQNKVNNINDVAELNPLNSFSNTMSYNFFLSFIVFMIGIFSSYLNSSYGSNISQILSGGFKWGLICYVVGSLIAAFIAGTVGVERSNTRQRFLKDIYGLKLYREQELERIKLHAKKEEDYVVENIGKKKITQLKKMIDNIQKEKKQQEEILKKEAEEKVELECEIFKPFLR